MGVSEAQRTGFDEVIVMNSFKFAINVQQHTDGFTAVGFVD